MQSTVLEVGESHLVSSHTYPNGEVVTHRSDVIADGKQCVTVSSLHTRVPPSNTHSIPFFSDSIMPIYDSAMNDLKSAQVSDC